MISANELPRAIQSRLNGAEVARGNLSDLLVGLPLELAEHEDLAMMLGETRDRGLDQLAQVPLAIEIIRPRRAVLELQRALVVIPVL